MSCPGTDTLVYVVIHHNDRRKAASAKAPTYVQRKHLVRCRLTHLHPQRTAQRGEHVLAATHVTGRPQAHTNQVATARDRGEK